MRLLWWNRLLSRQGRGASCFILSFSLDSAVALIAEVRLQRVVPSFRSSKLLQAPKGHYVELNFSLETSHGTPCIDDMYLEVRDGYSKSANLLGVFCGRNISGIVRSSGRSLWLGKTAKFNYHFRCSYSNKTINTTGKSWLTHWN